jgi:NAD(P)-dependent dehydrogenase (short-subunit alcohol dehydrogenase family)
LSSFPQQTDSHILQALSVEDGYNAGAQYSVSKLLVMYIVYTIANLVTTQDGEPEVIVTSTCPGYCASDLTRQYDKWYERLMLNIIVAVFARSAEEGSRTLVGSVNQGVESHGKFWKNEQITP